MALISLPNVTVGAVGQEAWWRRAACRGCDPEVFFPTGSTAPADVRQIERAKSVCRGCPVRECCLSWAMRFEAHGIWGGTTPAERRAERRAAPATA